MTIQTFVHRIESGKANKLLYRVGEVEGLVCVWKLDGCYLLTWEECPIGQQYDESTYTRDERHPFESISHLLDFLAKQGWSISDFEP